jgi:hypothetical protein
MKQQENNLPYYLGFNSIKGSYHFFLSLPDGSGRILSYVKYFYLDKGLDGALDTTTQPSEEIKIELKNYLSGKINYVFKKLRKNSKEQTVFKIPTITHDFSEVRPVVDSGLVRKSVEKSTHNSKTDIGQSTPRIRKSRDNGPGVSRELLVGGQEENPGPVLLKRRGRKPGSKNKPKLPVQ